MLETSSHHAFAMSTISDESLVKSIPIVEEVLSLPVCGNNNISTKLTSTKRTIEESELLEDLNNQLVKSHQKRLAMDGSVGVSMGITTEQIMVPDNMVGLIIGRGGEQITKLQVDSGCKIQMSQDSQGLVHRLCSLTGTAPSIAVAKSMIQAIISTEGNRASKDAQNGIGASFEMMVPGRLVSRIIGKGGEVIRALQEETGAKIVIIQDTREYAEEKPLRITGTPEVVEVARQRVEQVMLEEDKKIGGCGTQGRMMRNDQALGVGSSMGMYDAGYDVTETMIIPSNKVGLVMGKGGETIRLICSESGAHCQVDKSAPDGARDKSVVIKGRPGAVQRAIDMINDKVGGSGLYERSLGGAFNSMAKTTYPMYGNSGVVPQPDYSAQWAEYYRSLGMTREADLIEQQSRERAAQSQQPADYSAQWAEYYRSIGKIKEAEAIEDQMMRTKASVSPSPMAGSGQYLGLQPTPY